jgi:thiol:disulfide interchange protein DsbD
MLFFVILGFIAAGGENILQYPAAVIGLGAVVMALALSMLGVYTLQVPTAASQLEASIQKEGLLSSFGKGALAPVLGFACTGPLLAAAFGWAVQQPSHIAVLAFLCAGFGMALPYMLLGANPHWLSFLPRPGQWMVSFERVMGFLLLGMVIWLLHPLITQLGVEGLEWTLAFLVAVAFACWVIGQVDFSMSTAARWTYRGGALAMVLVAGGLIFEIVYPLQEAHERARASGADHTLVNGLDPLCPIPWQLWDPKTAMEAVCDDDPEHLDYAAALHDVCRANFNAVWTGGIPWQAWSPELVQRAVTAGRPVFVDFTAAYCTVCKANKRIAINTDEVRQKMMTLGVVPYRGDFTNGDDRIADILRTYDRAGVPLNLIYPANRPDQPIVLTPNLTKAYLLAKLDEAATNRADSPPFQQTTLRAARPSIP